MHTILLVEDEKPIRSMLQFALRKKGFNIIEAENGFEAVSIVNASQPDLILMDWMLPDISGVDVIAKLKQNDDCKDTPIIMLTAKTEESHKVAGLDAGADDYIQKPIRPRLLISRVKALLRRLGNNNNTEDSTNNLQIGVLSIDKERFEVFKSGQKIELAKKEFDILWLLSQKPGKVFGREAIYRKVWGSDVIVGNRTIDVHISKLREKVGSEIIKTIKGIGYKIKVPENL